MSGILCILCIVLNILPNVQGNVINIALGKTAYTNTNIPANNVLDGSNHTCTSIDTKDAITSASLTIDLGGFYNIFDVKTYNNLTEYPEICDCHIYYGTSENLMEMCGELCMHDSVKYITIRKPSYYYTANKMTICEVSVSGVPNNTNTNIALGKTAYTNTDISADNVVDGLTGRDDPCTTIDTGDLKKPAKITVDLGDLYNIFAVEIYNSYNETEASLLGDYSVYYGYRGDWWYACSWKYDYSIPAGGSFTHWCDHEPVKYITIQKEPDADHVPSRMTICEIKVKGIWISATTKSLPNKYTVIQGSTIIVLSIAGLVASHYTVVRRRRSDKTSPLMSIWSSQVIENPFTVDKNLKSSLQIQPLIDHKLHYTKQ